MRLIKYLIAAASGIVLMGLNTGCSSVMCGSSQSVSIKSRPAGAEVLVYNPECQVVCQKTTPCVATLQRSTRGGEPGNYTVLIRKNGFAPVQVRLTGRVNDAYYANLMFGGVGLFVDAATGAKWTLSPELVDTDSGAQTASAFKDGDVSVSLKPSTKKAPHSLAEYVAPQEN